MSIPTNVTENEANSMLTLQLTRMFKATGLEIRMHKTDTSQEIGIDYFFEVISTKNTTHEFLFALQNKGSQEVTFTKKSGGTQISFQLSLRHANYFYYELRQPLLFTVCDTTNDKIYWHAIQLDINMPAKIRAQKEAGKNSMQIEIDAKNTADSENFGRLIDAIKQSADAQFYKHKSGINIKADYNFITGRQKQMNIVEKAIDTINLFKGVNVLPIEVLEKLPPFKGTDKTAIKGETLETDNEEFFELIAQINMINDQYSLQDNSLTNEVQRDIKHILDYLRIHFIEHVKWIGKTAKFNHGDRICIHKLFTHNNCQCERCSYKDFAFNRTSQLLSQSNYSLSNDEKLRKAYTFYLITDYYNAYLLYKEIMQGLTISEDAITYIICKFNLMQLKKFVKSFMYGYHAQEIIDDIDKESFEFDSLIVPSHFRDVFNQLKDLTFFNNSLWKVDTILTDAQKISYNDKLGSYSINQKPDNLIIDFTRAYHFIEYNLLIYNEYREFEVLVNKALEAAFAFNTLMNPVSTKYRHFGTTMIEMWVLHSEASHIRYLLNKYNVKRVPTADPGQTVAAVGTYIENLIESKDYILAEMAKDNFGFIEKIRKVTGNILVIIAKVDMTDREANELFAKIIIFCNSIGNWKMLPTDEIRFFLNARKTELKNLQSLFEILSDGKVQGHGPFKSVVNYLADHTPKEQLDELFYVILGSGVIDETSLIESKKFHDLGYFLSCLGYEIRDKVKQIITAKLNVHFDATLFYYYCIYGLIDPSDDFLSMFVAHIPDFTKFKSGHEILTGKKAPRNNRLDELINLCYKYNIAFTGKYKNLSRRAIDYQYYDWLMDLEGFNYENFNPYWIMEYETQNYLEAFKNSPKLLNATREALKSTYIEGVAKIYFNHLASI